MDVAVTANRASLTGLLHRRRPHRRRFTTSVICTAITGYAAISYTIAAGLTPYRPQCRRPHRTVARLQSQ